MKLYGLCLLGVVVVVVVWIGYTARLPSPHHSSNPEIVVPAEVSGTSSITGADINRDSASAQLVAPAKTVQDDVTTGPQKSAKPRLTIRPGQPIPQMFPFETERKQMMTLAASQDPAVIPNIAAWLRHADTNVRETARQALLQMGSAAAVPHLEAAAASSEDQTEKQLLQEAIEFLSLPALMDVISSPTSLVSRP
jgi:HEAT repeats